jgi:hypothetical protein
MSADIETDPRALELRAKAISGLRRDASADGRLGRRLKGHSA